MPNIIKKNLATGLMTHVNNSGQQMDTALEGVAWEPDRQDLGVMMPHAPSASNKQARMMGGISYAQTNLFATRL